MADKTDADVMAYAPKSHFYSWARNCAGQSKLCGQVQPESKQLDSFTV